MKFFQVLMLIELTIAAIGAVTDTNDKDVFIPLLAVSGILYLASWAMTKIVL